MSTPKYKNLSPQFSEYIGKSNLKNPGDPTEIERYYIQWALVEAYCAHTDKRTPLKWVPVEARQHASGQSFGPFMPQVEPVGDHHTYFTKCQNLSDPIQTFVDLYRYVCGVDFRDAVQRLAQLHGLDSARLFGNSESILKSGNRLTYQPPTDPVRHALALENNFLAPSNFKIEQTFYSRASAPIEFKAGPVGFTFRVMRYFASDGAEIHIPLYLDKKNLGGSGSNTQHEFNYGPGAGKLPLYNLNYIDTLAPGGATVFLCEDLSVAVALSNIIIDSKRLGQNQIKATELYVATGWYGGARLADCVDFNPLWEKKVVFIPALNRSSYTDSVTRIRDFCLQAKVKEFRIYRPAVLKNPPPNESISISHEISDPWERHLAKSHVSLRDCESLVVKKIAENAVTWDDYRRWGEVLGLFQPGNDDTNSSKSAVLYTKTLPQLRENFPLNQEAGLKFDCFGAYENMAVLYGNKNSGKSYLATAVAVARACGHDFLGFDELPAAMVLYVDGETPGSELHLRFDRTAYAAGCNNELLEKNLMPVPLRADHMFPNIDLENEEQRNFIEKRIRESKSELVIFDNLQSLLPGFLTNNATMAWKSFHDWLLRLENIYKTGFLIVHHDNVGGNPAGTGKIEWQASALIHLTGRDALKKEIDKKDYPADLEMYKKFLNQNEVLFRAEARIKKMAGTSPFGGFLSMPVMKAGGRPYKPVLSRSPWKPIGHVIPARRRELSGDDSDALKAEIRTKYPDRKHPDEYKILEHLYIKGKATISEICLLLRSDSADGCSKGTANNRLKALRDEGIVRLNPTARGPSSYYELTEDRNNEEALSFPFSEYIEP